MNFEHMNAIQRRLHNAACVLGADGDEYGFEQLQRDAIAEIERLREHAVILAETAREVERDRCAKLCDEAREAVWPYHEAEVFKTAQTVCENLADRIRGLGA